MVASVHLLAFAGMGANMGGCSNQAKCDPPSVWWTCHETWKLASSDPANPKQCDRGDVLVCLTAADDASPMAAVRAGVQAQAKFDVANNPLPEGKMPTGWEVAFVDCWRGAHPDVRSVAPALNPQQDPMCSSLGLAEPDAGASCQAIVANPGAAACLDCAAGPCCMAYATALAGDPGNTPTALQCWAQHSLDPSVSCSPPPISAGKVAGFIACMILACQVQCDGNPYAVDAGP
jgi:hypothetical protein